MNIFETITGFDYLLIVAGVLGIFLGIVQICSKRCIGIINIEQYTAESAKKFSVISSVIYIAGGILTAAAPIAIKYINLSDFGFSLPTALPNWILLATVAILLFAQLSMFKKKI